MRAALGSIERLGPDHYRVSIEGKRKNDGKRTRHSQVVRGSRGDAEIALAKLKLEHGHADGHADDMTVDMAWRVYYEPTFDGRLAKSTARKYRTDYAHNLQPLFGERKVGSLTTRQIELGLMGIEKDYPRDHAYRLFRSFYNYLWNRSLISSNPFDRQMQVKKPQKREQPTMGFEQLSTWTKALDGFRHEATLLLYVYSGLRRGEALGLRTEDLEYSEADGVPMMLAHVKRAIDDDGDVVEVKNERARRTVVVVGWVAAHIRWLVDGLIPGWLAQNDDGSRVSGHTLSKRYKKWSDAHGLTWYPIRQLRTTYATLSQASGVDATVTSRALGHAKLSIDYSHYFMANAASQIAAARLLSESVGNTMLHAEKEKASLTSG